MAQFQVRRLVGNNACVALCTNRATALLTTTVHGYEMRRPLCSWHLERDAGDLVEVGAQVIDLTKSLPGISGNAALVQSPNDGRLVWVPYHGIVDYASA